jgi:hypothetical protein
MWQEPHKLLVVPIFQRVRYVVGPEGTKVEPFGVEFRSRRQYMSVYTAS